MRTKTAINAQLSRLVPLVLCTFFLSACETTTYSPSSPPATVASNPADDLSRAAASTDFLQRNRLYVSAARQYIEANDYTIADRTLGAVEDSGAQWLNHPDRDEFIRLMATTKVALQQHSLAQSYLGKLSRWTAPDYLLAARVCESLEDYLCAADAMIQAQIAYGHGHPELPTRANDQIWAWLGSSDSTRVNMATHRYHRAWWELLEDSNAAPDLNARQKAYSRWQRRYPSHPAAIEPPAFFQRLANYENPRIAVFLPLSGRLASVGKAVQNGMIARAMDSDLTTRLFFYDSAAHDLAQLWERALADGAQVSVGPLLKPNVKKFVDMPGSNGIPKLVLNYLDDRSYTQPGLYQFGIAIEDEAVSLIKTQQDNQHERILVVHGNNSWAKRAASAFLESWPHEAVLANFNDIKNLTETIGDAMDVSASGQRGRQIANIIGESLEFTERARKDIQSVVAFTNQVETRALKPALAFHFADHLPLFGTSQVVRGRNLDDLDGMMVTQMPLYTSLARDENIAATAFAKAFGLPQHALSELYALGYDAIEVAAWLPVLQTEPSVPNFADSMESANIPITANIPGVTGKLRLGVSGRIERSLQVAPVAANNSRR